MTQQPINPKDARKYANHVFELLEKNPEGLNDNELRLAMKAKDAELKLSGIARDMDQLKNQIQQAQARLRSLELQFENEQGRLNGMVDVLVEMKFIEKVEVPPKREPPSSRVPANGNGKAEAKTSPATSGRKAPKKKRSRTNKSNSKAATA